jgi:hypothetical protein
MSSYCNCQFNMLNIKEQLIAFNTFFTYNCWNSLHGVGLQPRDGMLTCN